MDGVGLALWGAGREPFLVFLGPSPFAAKAPFMEVGFSWISLDSLVRPKTFQWAKRDEAGYLSRALPLGEQPERSAHGLADADGHWGYCDINSVFQRLSPPPFAFNRLNPKATRARNGRSPKRSVLSSGIAPGSRFQGGQRDRWVGLRRV